jgi:hypothetical protein
MRILLLLTAIPAILIISVWLMRRRASRPRLAAIENPMTAYLLVAATSSLLQPHPAALVHLTMLLVQVATILALAHSRMAQITLHQWIISIALLVCGEALLHLVARAIGITALWVGSLSNWRIQIMAGDWMTYNQIILLALPIILAQARQNNRWYIAAGATIVVVFFSGQRAAWLALFAIFLVIGMLHNQRIAIVAGATLFVSMYLLWAPLVLADRASYETAKAAVADTSQPAPALTSDMARKSFWRTAAQHWQSNIWIGRGSYHFSSSYGDYTAYHAHNVPLDIAARYGIAGLLCGAWMYCTTLSSGLSSWRTPLDRDFARKNSTAIAILLAFCVLAMFGDVLWVLLAGILERETVS